MLLFNKKVIQQALTFQEIPVEHLSMLQDWQEMIVSKELIKHKETAVVSSFISNFLETILDSSPLSSCKNYSLAQEYSIAKGSALGEFFHNKQGDKVHTVFELKDAN